MGLEGIVLLVALLNGVEYNNCKSWKDDGYKWSFWSGCTSTEIDNVVYGTKEHERDGG